MMKRLPVLITAVATLALILGGNALLGWSTPTKAAGSATITMSSYPGDQPSLRSGQSPPPCVDNLGDPIACLQLDMDPTNGTGPCNPVDATTTVTVGSNHDVAVCLTNAGAEPTTLGFDLVYDDALNLCVPDTTACADVGKCLDSNPDANAGVSVFSTPSLGTGWDCTAGAAARPHCDNEPSHNEATPTPWPHGAGKGSAYLGCFSATRSSFPIGGAVSAPIAEVHMKALSAGTDNLSLENAYVADSIGAPIVDCNFGIGMCFGGTAIKVVPTPRPGVGGIVNLPPAVVDAASNAPSDGSGWPAGAYAGLAGAGAAAVIVLGAAGWYVGRRRLR